MKCSQCFAENADATKFCEACGASLALPVPATSCGACGFERRSSAKFCSNCGERFPVAAGSAPAPPGPRSAPLVEKSEPVPTMVFQRQALQSSVSRVATAKPALPPPGWSAIEPVTAAAPPAAAAAVVAAAPTRSRLPTLMLIGSLCMVAIATGVAFVTLRDSPATPTLEIAAATSAPLPVPAAGTPAADSLAAPVAVDAATGLEVPASDTAEEADEVQTSLAPPEVIKPPKAKRKLPTPVVAAAPVPVVEAAPVEVAPVAPTASLDDQYEQMRAECKSGFLGSRCRKKVRAALCAGQWAEAPPAGMSVCQAKRAQ